MRATSRRPPGVDPAGACGTYERGPASAGAAAPAATAAHTKAVTPAKAVTPGMAGMPGMGVSTK
ncbi:hypothetical protein, partial [Streptomyces sp. SID10853]|uniref:hypothetical protein n=1 Tax=Streptomyces sp. SID10853 TaxID=2706028 RepID=UPI0019435830